MNTNESQRKCVPRNIFTSTQRASDTISNYFLLFFGDAESYQIVARSSIKKLMNTI